MSKGTKIVLICAAMMVGFGIAIAAAGFMMGGSIMSVQIDGNGIDVHQFDGKTLSKPGERETKQSEIDGDVESIEIGVGACQLFIKEGKAFELEVQSKGRKVNSEKKGKVWHIETESADMRNWIQGNDLIITVSVPKGFEAKKWNIDLGAGKLEADRLAGKEVELQVGAGQMDIKKLESQATAMSVGAGEINVELAELSGVTKLECAMGELDMTVDGKEEDYGLECSVGMGSLRAGGRKISGMGGEIDTAGKTDSVIKADCGMGEIDIDFTR